MEGKGHRASKVLEEQGLKEDSLFDETRQNSQDSFKPHQCAIIAIYRPTSNHHVCL
jgi:hypothetical protein